MTYFRGVVFLIFVLGLLALASAEERNYDKTMFRPPIGKIKEAVALVPFEYQKDVFLALNQRKLL